jgi:hypothetical protein
LTVPCTTPCVPVPICVFLSSGGATVRPGL